MNSVIDSICKYKIIPVASIENAEDSLYVTEALLNAGLPLIEITFRTLSAAKSIEMISNRFQEVVVGAGTVFTIDQAQRAIDNGARCIVAPGINEDVVRYAQSREVNVFPGVMTPTEIEKALSLGLNYVKYFPAEAAGGIKMIKALSGPYSQVKFLPTGGINTKNVQNYLDLPNVFACGGSWMVDKSLIANKEYDKITAITKETLNMILAEN